LRYTGHPSGRGTAADQAEECIAAIGTTTAETTADEVFRGTTVPDVPTPPASPAAGRPNPVSVRLATVDDAPAIMAIYNVEVRSELTTFDLVERTLAEQQLWLTQRSGAFSAVVALIGDEVVGFASLSPYKERAAYRTTVEDSIYVSRDHPRTGIGRTLMERLIAIASDSGFHSVIARIEASGTASRALHASCGFELVGVEREVGRKFNRWLDVAIMQLML